MIRYLLSEKLPKSLKISDEKIDNARSKEYVHFRNGMESEWTPTYESRTTGKINSIDLIYFLRACGSNTVSISFLPYKRNARTEKPDLVFFGPKNTLENNQIGFILSTVCRPCFKFYEISFQLYIYF